MSVTASETICGGKYRPTQTKSFDLRGRAWLTRSAPGWESKAIKRMRLRYERLSGQECYTLSLLARGAVLMRKHWRTPGRKTQSEWVAVPSNYKLRELKGGE
jgi:hypothetical protein